MQTQDEERRRIARELHDGVGQLLAAMSMNFSMLERENAKLDPAAAKTVEANIKLIECRAGNPDDVAFCIRRFWTRWAWIRRCAGTWTDLRSAARLL